MLTRTARILIVTASLLAGVLAVAPTPAGATGPVDPRGVALSPSASCAQGDIEIEYGASGVERQLTSFTAENGTVLHAYDVRVYASTHDGVEFVLSQTDSPPPPGTIVAVHVTIGTSPPGPTSGEFFLAYRCDSTTNADGGANQVLYVCVAMFGGCPTSAEEFVALDAGPVPGPSGPRLVPAFTG